MNQRAYSGVDQMHGKSPTAPSAAMKPGVTSPPRLPCSAANGSPRSVAVSTAPEKAEHSAGADHMPVGSHSRDGYRSGRRLGDVRAVRASITSMAVFGDPFATPTMPESQYPPTTALNEQRLSGTSPP